MFPNTKPVLVALLLAYRALAAPTSHDQQDQVQSVIDALKVQLKDLNPSWNPWIIDDVESTLKANGVLDAQHITALNQKIEVSKPHGCIHNLSITIHVCFSTNIYKYLANRKPS